MGARGCKKRLQLPFLVLSFALKGAKISLTANAFPKHDDPLVFYHLRRVEEERHLDD